MARVQFQLDEHIPNAVAEALRRRGIVVVTATEAGLRGASDTLVLSTSHEQQRVLVTNDGDFLRLHRDHPHAGIAYCEQGSRTVGQIVANLEERREIYGFSYVVVFDQQLDAFAPVVARLTGT